MLRDAYEGKVVAPMRDCLHPLDMEGAYAIQEINTRFWVGQGRRMVGRKASLTSEAVQRQLGIDQTDCKARAPPLRSP
jgi:2-keto-4-pentenoate hydratase